MRIDIKAIEGLLSACKAVVGSSTDLIPFPEGLKATKSKKIPLDVFEQVREAINKFEESQK